MDNGYLKKEDYEEPCCPLKMKKNVERIPVGRILQKFDSYLDEKDFEAAARHLEYWISEAEVNNDLEGKLTLANEQIGLYRKQHMEKECLAAIDVALKLVNETGSKGTIVHGTTLLNAATGLKEFDRATDALSLYKEAKEIYEGNLKPLDARLGGLYNNMALTLTSLENFDEAKDYYEKAIGIMKTKEAGDLEVAITYLNLADLAVAKKGLSEAEDDIAHYLQLAQECLDTDELKRDGYYAFVCEKCAPVYHHYGYFMYAMELEKRAREFYERA